MIVVFVGKGLFGIVDQVPGACHVATRFFYIGGVPIVPLDSWAILEPKQIGSVGALVEAVGGMATRIEDDVRGVRVPFSVKSVLMTYVRTLLWPVHLVSTVLLLFLIVDALVSEDDGRPPPLFSLFSAIMCATSVGGGYLLWQSYRRTHATPARAAELRGMLGLRSRAD